MALQDDGSTALHPRPERRQAVNKDLGASADCQSAGWIVPLCDELRFPDAGLASA